MSLRDPGENGVVWVNEVAKVETLGVDQSAIDKPLELSPLSLNGVRRLEIMALVPKVKLVHHGLFSDGPDHRFVEGCSAVQHDTQEAARVGLSSSPIQKRFQPCAGLRQLVGGRDLVLLIAMHEANAGIYLSLIFKLVAIVVPAKAPMSPSIIEAVSSSDAVFEMVECAVKGEPVKILWLGFAGALVVEAVNPARQRLIGRDATKCSLPEMAVRGEEAGHDPMTAGIPGLAGGESGWRITRCDSRELPVRADGQIAGEDFFVPVGHREEPGILYYKLDRRLR